MQQKCLQVMLIKRNNDQQYTVQATADLLSQANKLAAATGTSQQLCAPIVT